jgi:hypothetical protein
MQGQESEGEVTQEETECFDRSDRFILSLPNGVLLGEPFRYKEGSIKTQSSPLYVLSLPHKVSIFINVPPFL